MFPNLPIANALYCAGGYAKALGEFYDRFIRSPVTNIAHVGGWR